MKLKILFTIIIPLLTLQTLFGQTHDINYTQQENIRVAGVTTDAGIDALSVTDKQTTFVFTDGFGRAMQTVTAAGTPLQKDLVQPIAYDNLGRQTTGYLPYTDGFSGSYYRVNPVSGQASFYSNTSTYLIARDNSPFASQVFENSPLQRLLQSGMVGDGFQPGVAGAHYKTVKYRSNNSTADGSILLWNANGTYTTGTVYADNTLSVTDGKDEDNVETLVYADLAGRTILKRQIHSGGNYDTYYLYNVAGMLSYLIPPKATAALAANSYSLTTAPLNTLVFNYTYDGHGRVVTKTVPASGIMYIIYDPLNRPVLMQDANMRTGNKWNYIKYDIKGRAISQGVYVDATHTTLSAMQAYIAGLSYTTWYESRSGTLTGGGYYTNVTFPTTGTTPLAWAYFDDYDLNQDGTDDYGYATQSDGSLPGEGSATLAKLRGVPTIVSTTTIGNGITAGLWLTTATFYDKRGNPIQVRSNNHLYTGAAVLPDTKTVANNFIGVPITTKVEKITGASTSVKVYTALTYDQVYRITGVSQKYNTGTMQVVAVYTYNEIGQVIKKGVGYGGSAGVWLQNVDMRYNIRGQLLTINNSTLTNDMTTAKTNGDTNDVFGMQFFYDQAADGSIGNAVSYNGKLTAAKWMSVDNAGTKSKERSYKFAYDDLDRYTAENYGERTTAGTGSFNQNLNGFDEYGITYDLGGNITHLNRKSSTMGGSTNTIIDNLTYTYSATNTNQLASVADAGTSAGFPGGTGNYAYDTNGNLTTDPYKSLSLTYNDLNKTNVITVTAGSGQHIDYTYDASGTLLRKRVYGAGVMPPLQTTTDYIDGFVYVTAGTGTAALSYFPMPEGRVLYSSGTFTQEFIIGDQQGNARISFKNNGSNAAVVTQENSYYGFGMAFLTSPVPIPTVPNKKLYNGGNEWQNDYSNLPDYYQTFYRNYDAVLGRFVGVDPMPESAADLTTYNYGGNNPITYNDPMGNNVYHYNINPFSPGFNSQVGDIWSDPGNPAAGGGAGDNGNARAANAGTDSDIGYGSGGNASFYAMYDAAYNAAISGDPLATQQYAAAYGRTIYQKGEEGSTYGQLGELVNFVNGGGNVNALNFSGGQSSYSYNTWAPDGNGAIITNHYGSISAVANTGWDTHGRSLDMRSFNFTDLGTSGSMGAAVKGITVDFRWDGYPQKTFKINTIYVSVPKRIMWNGKPISAGHAADMAAKSANEAFDALAWYALPLFGAEPRYMSPAAEASYNLLFIKLMNGFMRDEISGSRVRFIGPGDPTPQQVIYRP
jgi:RHS repeat-associated protein